MGEDDREAINAVLSAQQTHGTAAMWTRFWGDMAFAGTDVFGSSGVVRGWDGVLARYKKNYPGREAMDSWIFGAGVSVFWADAALIRAWHLKREKDDVGGVFTLCGNASRMVGDHSRPTERGGGSKDKPVAERPEISRISSWR